MGIVQLSMFDGKVCPKCKEWRSISDYGKSRSNKDGLQVYCKPCRHIYATTKGREYYYQNIEKARRVQRLWYHENKEKLKNSNQKRAREWYQNNKDRARADRVRRYQKDMEGNRTKAREWYYQNIDQAKRRRKHYKRVKSAYINSINQARRARQKAIGGKYTDDQWMQLCDWFGNICLACGTTEDLTVDHVIPLDPGSNTIDNLQPLCRSCNSKKRRKTIDYRDPDRLVAFLETIHGQEIFSRPTDCSDTTR